MPVQRHAHAHAPPFASRAPPHHPACPNPRVHLRFHNISHSPPPPPPPHPPQSKDVEGGPQYRQLLIAGVHRCAVRFPSVAPSVVHLLMDFLGDSSAASALEVVHFVREIAEASPDLRATVMSRLVDTFRQTRSGRVCASSLWVMSEYAATPAEVRGALETLRTSLGDLPLVRGWGGGR